MPKLKIDFPKLPSTASGKIHAITYELVKVFIVTAFIMILSERELVTPRMATQALAALIIGGYTLYIAAVLIENWLSRPIS